MPWYSIQIESPRPWKTLLTEAAAGMGEALLAWWSAAEAAGLAGWDARLGLPVGRRRICRSDWASASNRTWDPSHLRSSAHLLPPLAFGHGRPGTISIKGQGNLPANKNDTAIFSWLICPVPISFHLQSYG